MAEIVGLCPVWIQAQYFNNDGLPLSGGFIHTFADNADEPVETYTDRTGTVQNTNPIQLDTSGRLRTSIWLKAGAYYTLVLADNNDNELARTRGVTYQKLVAGDNVTLDPVGGVGGSVIVSAAGPYDGVDNGHGPSHMFSLTMSGLDCNGLAYNNWNEWATVYPNPPEVTYQGGGKPVFVCEVAGAYTFQITTLITFSNTADPWPAGVSVFGIQFAASSAEIINQSSHNRFSSFPYDGVGEQWQQATFTDTFIVTANAGDTFNCAVYFTNPNYPDTPLYDCNCEVIATRFGATYSPGLP
jgi:hypothetical protein